jgi:dipeptidase E
MVARVVLLGGGFSMDTDSLLDDYLLGLTGRSRPKVCFLPTASGDAAQYVERFHAELDDRCRTSVLRLFERDGTDPGDLLLDQDVVYVGGGNTANMLAVWRLHGVDRALVEAYRRGVLLCGISAGMLCWFSSGLSDSFGPLRPLHDGLRLLPDSACPHYDSERGRRPGYRHAVASNELPGGWALDDGAAALFEDGSFVEAVARRPGAHLHQVTAPVGDGVGDAVETAMPARLLG